MWKMIARHHYEVQQTWWWAVQKSAVQAKAFFHFVSWFSHQAGIANRWAQ
jgi:hypothetical protein